MICKQVTRTVIPLMLSVIFVFSSVLPAKADTIQAHGTVSTSYGSYTWSAQQAASTLPITISLPYVGISFAYNSGTSFSIDYSLKNQYSGVVTITVTGNNTWSVDNVNILTSGCNLDSLPSDHASYKTSHSFNLRLKNSDKFSFVIYGAGSTVFLGSTSVSVAHNMSVDNLEQQIDSTLDLYLPGMSTSLSGLGYDSNPNTSLSADTLAYDISIIKTYIDGIEGYLNTSNTYIDQIEGYIDGLENLLTAINTNTSNLSALSIPIYSYSAYYYALKYGTFYNNYSTWAGSSVGVPTIILNKYATPSYDGNYSIVIPAGVTYHFIYVCSGNPVFDYYQENVGLINANNLYYDYISGWRMYDLIYTNETSNAISMSICMSRNAAASVVPLYFGSNVPEEIGVTYNIDFENKYTRLLQQLINAVGDISQQQIVENNTNINNYNNYQTQINNVENNYYNEYNTYNTDIQNNNTFDFSGLSSDGVTVYQNLFTSVFQIDLIKWPLLIILLGLIVVIILG